MRGGMVGSGDDEDENGGGSNDPYGSPSPTSSGSPSGSVSPGAASGLMAKESMLLSAMFGGLTVAAGWFGLL